MEMSPRDLIDLGIAGLLLAALFGGAKGVWVYGRVHQEMIDHLTRRIDELVRERDEWKRLALRGTEVAEKAVTAVAKGSAAR